MESELWLQTLDSVIPAIVVIRVCIVKAFDGRGAAFSHATGFVVDKQNGIILSNRHVVNPGPITADAIFVNKEEVELRPVYRDPVHDFGFFKFDPSKVKFMPLCEIEMAPDGAKVGVEIRVVGNDAGEKLSILPGILAKLDRDAPKYGAQNYNDFNTFYYAAASSTSGGSSGSPVLDIMGRAVALNAGGSKGAASSFYLPLDRAVRALSNIQMGKSVTRGTLQTIFRHSAFDEVKRLGLIPKTEGVVRKAFPKETGMLVVDQVVPSSVAHDQLQPGDILVRFGGELQTKFIPIEDYMDNHIGEMVHVEIERGGVSYAYTFKIQDLHAITPSRFFEVSGAIFHELSYQQARNTSLPVGSVFMAQSGHMLVRARIKTFGIVTAIGVHETPTLDEFIKVMKTLPNGTRTTVQFFMFKDRHRVRTAVFTMDRQWFPMQLSTRNDTDGLWHAVRFEPPVESFTPEIPSTPALPLTYPKNEKAERVLQSLVLVTFNIPFAVDGIGRSTSYSGAGVVVDKVRGHVLVDRNTVAMPLGDVALTVAASIEVAGTVVFIHPIHNYAIVQYDPKLIGPTIVHEVHLEEMELKVSQNLEFIGLTGGFTSVMQSTKISKIDRLNLADTNPPQYRASNVEVVQFERVTASVGGVFMNEAGNVTALWLSYGYQDEIGRNQIFRGLPVTIVQHVVQTLRQDKMPHINMLPAQHCMYALSQARSGFGLTDYWVRQIELCHDDRRKVLSIKRCVANTDAAKVLKSGDLLLSIDGKTVSKDIDVERACYDKSELDLVVFRKSKELKLRVKTSILPNLGTERVVSWSGLMLQAPHYAVVSLGYMPANSGGVYCSRWCYGSPAHKYGLHAMIWIIEANGCPTPTLDTFLDVVNSLPSGKSVRLKTVDLSTKVKVFTLKTDYHYWPSVEVRRMDTVWKRILHSSNKAS